VQARARPTSAQWNRFLRVMAELRVWEWRNWYRPEEFGRTITDGIAWVFSCRAGPRAVESRGRNAYPGFGEPQKITLDQKA
jgi:hypothetical protein